MTDDVLVGELASLVSAAVHRAQPLELQVADELNLTLTQLKMMVRLDGHPEGMSLSCLAQQVGLSAPAASRAADALVRAGLVERTEDSTDRRSKRVALSPRGQEAMRPLWPARHEGLAELVSVLEPAQRTALHDALQPLMAAVGVDRPSDGTTRTAATRTTPTQGDER